MTERTPVIRPQHRGQQLALAALAALLAQPSLATAQGVCTSFEATPAGVCEDEALFALPPAGDFAIGTSPTTATFMDGNVMTVGVPVYYHSGVRSWHVGPGVTATIQFESPASAIELFFRDTAGGGPSRVRVVGVDDESILISGDGNQFFQQVGVNNVPVGIDRIEVVNESSVADVVVDDVSFVPEPSARIAGLLGLACVALLAGWRGSGASPRLVRV